MARSRRELAKRWPYALIVALVGLAVWMMLPSRERPRRMAPASPESEPTATAEAPRSLPPPPAARPGAVRPPGMPDPGGLAKRDVVSDTVWSTRYPPRSQPLTAEMTDVIHPNRRFESPMPVNPKGSGPNGAPDPDKDLYYLLTATSFSIPSGSPAVATLQVFRGASGGGNPVSVEVTALRLFQFGQPSFTPVDASTLAMVDDGTNGDAQAGDHVYTLSFVPSSIPALANHSGQIRLEVDFVAQGGAPPKTGALVFLTSGQAPAIYTGTIHEQLQAQGLVLTAQVEVSQAGDYVLQGLLFDADDKPVGFAIEHPTFAVGTQSVDFLFFGLLFYEAQAVAPYHFRTLTGYRLPTPGDPHKADMPMWGGDYVTQTYKLSDFSPAEWSSPERNQAIAAAQGFAAARPQGDPLPPPPPELVGQPLKGGPQPGSGSGTGTATGTGAATGAGAH